LLIRENFSFLVILTHNPCWRPTFFLTFPSCIFRDSIPLGSCPTDIPNRLSVSFLEVSLISS
ncbi:hypothetical protein QSI17_22040, partial [Aeromonas hydrophila]|uniref:hypothetical protein n=1 Tax=Aeromonas hydrophila TaxID=644 RepID=UPI00256EEE4E